MGGRPVANCQSRTAAIARSELARGDAATFRAEAGSGLKLQFAPKLPGVLPGVEPGGRLESAAKWNALFTHRVRVASAAEIDDEIRAWLRDAYLAPG